MKKKGKSLHNIFHSFEKKITHYLFLFKKDKVKWNIFFPLATIIGFICFWFTANYLHDAGRISKRSIAVLPFVNLSDNKDNEYFADGMTDEIIGQISKISDIMIISRNSAFQYKNTEKDISKIADELGVASIFMGSINLGKENLIISGELIDSRSGNSLWNKTYDKRIENVFDIQNDFVEMITNSLNVKVSTREKKIINSKPTESIKAYNLYLNGRSEYFKYTYQALERSIVYYKQALNFDPSYALAYNGMTDSYSKIFLMNQDPLYGELSLQSSTRTLLINNDLPEAYSSRAIIMNYLGRITQSIKLNEKAIELGIPSELLNLGINYWDKGDLSEALKHQINLKANDPYNSQYLMRLGWIYQSLQAYDDFNWMITEAIDKKPNDIELNWVLIHQFCFERKWDKARKLIERLIMLDTRNNYVDQLASDFFLFSRDFNEALKHLQKIKHMSFDQKTALSFLLYRKWGKAWATPILEEIIALKLERIVEGEDISSLTRLNLSKAYSVIGDKESAIQWLEDSVNKGWTHYKLIEIDPRFDLIRQDPRYRAQIESMKLIISRERIESGYKS